MANSIQKFVALTAAGLLTLGLSGCSDVITGADHNKKEDAAGEESAKNTEPKSTQEETGESVAPTATGDFGEKPEFTPGSGPQATSMDVQVLKEGTGKEIKPGDTVKVNYAGITWDGKVFDSSFDRGEPAEFSLNQVIDGWKNGLPGYKVGSRLLMIIPPDQAYGEAGTGHELGGKTLTFVVDVLDAHS